MIKMIKLIKFTKELLDYLEWNNNLKEGGRYGPDYFFEKDDIKCTVEIRDKLDLDTKNEIRYKKNLKI